MLIPNQLIETKINNMNFEWFKSKGYICNCNDIIKIKAEDLQDNSNKKISVLCDYCLNKGKEIIINKTYYKYFKSKKSFIPNDCCGECLFKYKNKELSQYKKLSYEKINKEFSDSGYVLISNYSDYINNESLLNYICPIHIKEGVQKISYGNLYTGKGCRFCGIESVKNKLKHNQEDVFACFNKMGFIVEPNQTYVSSNILIKCRCIHHKDIIQEKSYSMLFSNKSCRFCFYESISGKNNYGWKGGITKLQHFVRKSIIDWVKTSLKFYNYKCIITGYNGYLSLHHLFPFHKILLKTIKKNNLPIYKEMGKYTEEEKLLIKKTVLEIHYEYGFGIPLHPVIHKIYHNTYGKQNFNFGLFMEFITRLHNGEFSEILKNNNLILCNKLDTIHKLMDIYDFNKS